MSPAQRQLQGRIGVVADDLTGAGDTGLQFHRGGFRSWLLSSFPPKDDLPVPGKVRAIAVNAGSRHLEAKQAAECVARVARWLQAMDCWHFYHKIDSTLRGNLAFEVSRLLSELDLDMAIIAPAFPLAGRITVGGFQLVGGMPVFLSAYANDPLAPVKESHIPTLLAPTNEKVDLVDLRTVLAGTEAIAGAFAEARSSGVRMLVVDAVRTEDLHAIAKAIEQSPLSVLPVGSAGLASMLTNELSKTWCATADYSSNWQGGGALLPADSPSVLVGYHGYVGRVLSRTPPALVISGSPNPVTLEQINHMGTNARLVLVDVRQLLLTEASAQERAPNSQKESLLASEDRADIKRWAIHDELAMATRQALQGLLAGRDVIVTGALTAKQVAQDRELGINLGMTQNQLGASLASALGTLAYQVSRLVTLGGVVITGGETAAAVCSALSATWLELVDEVLPAIPVARILGRNLRVVTKSGGFGEPGSLQLIVDYLRQTQDMF
ncbi:MAG: four-carbon acid sugar kinase family protein [Cyanobacteria bacterium NC_groundwater_1444_Ag_S-0.65um_54_12]|nr:four-carbon acid sugar kinase family protein [Cyanobacteria bacterium NC_groundwater_1444_Ag_S-0.65um_54_12]